jgi:hypothetical protein
MSHSGEAASVVVTLTPCACRALHRIARVHLPETEANAGLLDALNEAEMLAIWLREAVRLELSPANAAIIRELQQQSLQVNRSSIVIMAEDQIPSHSFCKSA